MMRSPGFLHVYASVGIVLLLLFHGTGGCQFQNHDPQPSDPSSRGTQQPLNEACFYACLDAIALSPRDLISVCPNCTDQVDNADQYTRCLDREGCTEIIIEGCRTKCSW